MQKSEKIKKAICSIINDMGMDQDTKFGVLEYLYNQYELEVDLDCLTPKKPLAKPEG